MPRHKPDPRDEAYSPNAPITVSNLAPLTDPGTAAGRVAQFFREKAFWTFGRGQRLNDLRRLVRQYGRTQDKVFPSGQDYKGGTYGSDVNFPVPDAERIAVVTGAASGIGESVARGLSAKGWHCVLLARREDGSRHHTAFLVREAKITRSSSTNCTTQSTPNTARLARGRTTARVSTARRTSTRC